MVQVKAHLGNRWPKLIFLFLPIESELTGIPVHPQLHSAGRRGLDCCVNFDLDLKVLQLILTPYHNALTQKIRVFKLPEKPTAKLKLKRERGDIQYTTWGGVYNHIYRPLTLLNWSQFKMFRKSSFLNGEYVFMTSSLIASGASTHAVSSRPSDKLQLKEVFKKEPENTRLYSTNVGLQGLDFPCNVV